MKRQTPFALERRTIEHIPAAERHGKPWHQLALWFSTNVQINTLITGAVTIGMGLDLTWAIISIVVGNLVGGLFMAYHPRRGPNSVFHRWCRAAPSSASTARCCPPPWSC